MKAMTPKTLRAAKMLADSSGDDQSLDDIIAALCGYGPLLNHSGDQLAAMLVRHILQANNEVRRDSAAPGGKP